MKKTRCHPTKGDTVFCLVGDYAISENFIIGSRVLIDAAAIAGVALDGVDDAVFDFLDDTDMVGLTVLRAGAALVVPIEEDNHAGCRFYIVICPLATILEPSDAVYAACVLRADAGFDVTALISAPADEAGAPFNTTSESIPGPVRFTAYVADLRQSHLNDHIIRSVYAVEY